MTIYVLRSDNLVKIGVTDNLRARLSAITGSSPVPVEVVGHMPGDREVEQHLHQRFRAHHFSGEWFVCTPTMMTIFDAILTPGLPELAGEKKQKRVGSDSDADFAKATLREYARKEWPDTKQRERVLLLAQTLGWNTSRVKDLYYGDTRTALRAFELEELREMQAA